MTSQASLKDRDAIDAAFEKAIRLVSGSSSVFIEVRLSESSSTTIALSGKDIDSCSSGNAGGGSIRVLNKGVWGFSSFNDYNDMESAYKKAIDCSILSNGSKGISYKRREAVKAFFATSVEIDFSKISIEEKMALMRGYNNILLSSTKVQTTRAQYRDTTGRYRYCNSEGSELFYDRKYCGISLSSIAKDGSIIQPFHDSVSGYAGYELALGHESRAENVAAAAVELLSAESAPGGRCGLVMDQRLAGVFIHEAFGHLSEADHLHENEKLKSVMKLGRRFGPEGFSVIDDGSIKSLAGYIPFDDEGVLPLETYLIKDGRLSSRLHSRETASSMDEAVTGNARAISSVSEPLVRMTNTYIMNGTCARDELIAGAGDGIYASGVIGGQTNLEMFTFTAARGYEIKNGRFGRRYRDIVFSGNVFTTLSNIAMIGNDRLMFGGLGGCGKGGQSPLPVSYGGPHLLIKDVLVGGRT